MLILNIDKFIKHDYPQIWEVNILTGISNKNGIAI